MGKRFELTSLIMGEPNRIRVYEWEVPADSHVLLPERRGLQRRQRDVKGLVGVVIACSSTDGRHASRSGNVWVGAPARPNA
jgi:hypothetical protein